jgi:hypothetical protein
MLLALLTILGTNGAVLTLLRRLGGIPVAPPLPGGQTMLHSDRLTRRCCWIVLALLLMSCQQRDVTSGSTRTPASAEPSALARVTPHPDFADTVITLVNQERTAAGCPDVCYPDAVPLALFAGYGIGRLYPMHP